MTALFQVKLVDADGIHPNETIEDSPKAPECCQTIRRDWQDIVVWAEKNSLAQRRIALGVCPSIRECLKDWSAGVVKSENLQSAVDGIAGCFATMKA
jgi:hypothetical protein